MDGIEIPEPCQEGADLHGLCRGSQRSGRLRAGEADQERKGRHEQPGGRLAHPGGHRYLSRSSHRDQALLMVRPALIFTPPWPDPEKRRNLSRFMPPVRQARIVVCRP